MINLSDKLGDALNRHAQNGTISDICPLISNPKWNCRPHDKGNELFCKSISGYSRCTHYQKWFHYILAKAIAKEMTKIPTKKKNQKEN